MLRTVGEQPSLWESLLPAAALVMPAELERVDRLLADERFFAPYRVLFHPVLGRPSIPIETYLRLMFLKYRYRLGFEPLCREVTDSISWQRFCRIPLGGRVPHPTTLMKITSRCGETVVEALNDALLAKAAEVKVLKVHKLCGSPAKDAQEQHADRSKPPAPSSAWSAGAPAAKDGSTSSNATTPAGAPAWTLTPACAPGPATESSPTTSSRSRPHPLTTRPTPPNDSTEPTPATPDPLLGLLQVEVVRVAHSSRVSRPQRGPSSSRRRARR